jgi:hypothetical protein
VLILKYALPLLDPNILYSVYNSKFEKSVRRQHTETTRPHHTQSDDCVRNSSRTEGIGGERSRIWKFGGEIRELDRDCSITRYSIPFPLSPSADKPIRTLTHATHGSSPAHSHVHWVAFTLNQHAGPFLDRPLFLPVHLQYQQH